MRLPLPPMEVWPTFEFSVYPGEWIRLEMDRSEMGKFSLAFGPFYFGMDASAYTMWMTDVIRPEGRMMREHGGRPESNEPDFVEPTVCSDCQTEISDIRTGDGLYHTSLCPRVNVSSRTPGWVHPDDCPCGN